MSDGMRKKLKTGFTLARWGVDLCIGCLFLAIAVIVSAFSSKGSSSTLHSLLAVFVIVMIGIVFFAIGRVIVGMQSRKLNLHTKRPLTEEESWFVRCMIQNESEAIMANAVNTASRAAGSAAGEAIGGAASMKVVHSFHKVGRRYRSRNFLVYRWPLLVSLAVSIVIAGISFI